MQEATAFVVEAELELDAGTDPAGVGAAVTTDLCGHWEHPGVACVWPHNCAVDADTHPARFRTLVVTEPADAAEVAARITAVLRAGEGWRAVAVRERPVAPAEHDLAGRLLAGPRRPRET